MYIYIYTSLEHINYFDSNTQRNMVSPQLHEATPAAPGGIEQRKELPGGLRVREL
jgi:hypothetical protein